MPDGRPVDVYVGLGSNLDADRRLREAVGSLEAEFGPLRCSAVYRTPAIGDTTLTLEMQKICRLIISKVQ